jgi:taurine---2-oxoglutarate transaminase
MTKLTSKEMIDLSREYTFFSWSVQGQVNPIPVAKAEGIYFWDADGKRYIDFSSQLMNTNIGHQHPASSESHSRSSRRADLCQPWRSHRTARSAWQETGGDHFWCNLKKTFFTLGGAEANENAIKIARFYTGRHKILARYRSYHGATHGAVALTGDYRRLAVEPTMPGGSIFWTRSAIAARSGRRKNPALASASSTSRKSSSMKGQIKSPPLLWKAWSAQTG